ncbi:hypothetical protein Pcinc_016430 [Petrolisthes cinctipes]|uniref:Uncharacterized protein n=1 Tax=Petrolisthes cinctipes TaxID=88211 RepID=A0AAE1FSV8_PETCI|nr:hypothetical protein Pcinc_016430 [Petrolisthes cinctipes]
MQVYLDLTQDSLLVKCLMGKNQNPNESLHSKIWSTLLKTKFYVLETVQFSSTLTILQHNFGYQRVNIMKELGFGDPTTAETNYLSAKDKSRIEASQRKKLSKKRKRTESDAAYRTGAF